MKILPPGLRFLCSSTVIALGSCGASYGVSHFLEARFGLLLPKALRYCIIPLLWPVYISACNLYMSWKHRRKARQLGAQLIPVCNGRWPGNVDLLIRWLKRASRTYPGDNFVPVIDKLGPMFMLRFLWKRHIITIEPEHVKQVLATEFDNFVKGERFVNTFFPVLGVGVFNSDGEMWKFHRTMTRPFFHRDRIGDLGALFGVHADTAVARMVERAREGHALDAQDLLARFTLDSATEFLFGSCVDALKGELQYALNVQPPASKSGAKQEPEGNAGTVQQQNAAEQFANAFAEAQTAIADRGNWGILAPLYEFWHDKVDSPMGIVHAFIEPILENAINKKRVKEAAGLPEKKDEIEDGETPLDYLVKHTEDKVILRDEILNIMIAGRDTTASATTFVLYLLAQHPNIVQRLRAEILNKVGPTNAPTLDDIRDMKFLRAVINETLRLYPPVPFDVRQSLNATTMINPIPGGKPLYFPAETGVTYSVFMMHRRKDLWGPDAEEFDPERFLDERLHKYLTPNPFIFLPFNAGPRICLGQQYAYNEVSYILVRILQTFDRFELDDSARPPDAVPPQEWKNRSGRQAIEHIIPKAHLSMYAYKGLWVRLHEASSS